MRSLSLPVHNISDRKYSSRVTASKLNKRSAQFNTLFAFCFWFVVPGARPVLHRRTNSFGGVGPTDRVYSPNRQHKPNHFLPVHACIRILQVLCDLQDKLPPNQIQNIFSGCHVFILCEIGTTKQQDSLAAVSPLHLHHKETATRIHFN